jgi:UDP-glucose 4-epimerase
MSGLKVSQFKKALVTGGAGFIGCHLCRRLIVEGVDVRILDDFSTGSLNNIADLDFGKCEVITGSSNDAALVAQSVLGVDIIFHLASTVGVAAIMQKRMRTLQNAATGIMTVADAAAQHRIPLVFASTSEVYGDSHKMPLSETDTPGPGPSEIDRWGYACGKLFGEFVTLAQHRERLSPAMVVRFFNTVGPRQTGQYGMVLPKFVSAALKGEPIVVHGDGSQKRCLTAVSEVIEALMRLIGTNAAWGQVINIGGQDEITILDLAKLVIQETGSTSNILCVPHEEIFGKSFADIQRRVPDISRLNHLTNFEPSIPIIESVRQVVAFLKTSNG